MGDDWELGEGGRRGGEGCMAGGADVEWVWEEGRERRKGRDCIGCVGEKEKKMAIKNEDG